MFYKNIFVKKKMFAGARNVLYIVYKDYKNLYNGNFINFLNLDNILYL